MEKDPSVMNLNEDQTNDIHEDMDTSEGLSTPTNDEEEFITEEENEYYHYEEDDDADPDDAGEYEPDEYDSEEEENPEDDVSGEADLNDEEFTENDTDGLDDSNPEGEEGEDDDLDEEVLDEYELDEEDTEDTEDVPEDKKYDLVPVEKADEDEYMDIPTFALATVSEKERRKTLIKKESFFQRNKKKLILGVFALIFLTIAGLGGREWWTVNHLSMSQHSIHAITGGQEQLSINANRKAKWKSSAPTIATVDDNGNVKFISNGEAKISAKYLWKEVTCDIIIDDPKLNTENLEMVIGQQEEVKVENTTFEVTSERDNEMINYENGTVTAVSPGSSGLKFNAGGREMHCAINIKTPEIEKEHECKKGESIALKTKNWPVKTQISWSSSNEMIARPEIAQDGSVQFRGENVGVATVSATINGTVYKTIVKVTGDQGLEIEASDLAIGDSETLRIKNYVEGYKVEWIGAQDNKDGTANLQGLVRGSTTIKAIVDTGIDKVELTKTITVRDKTLNNTEWTGGVGSTFNVSMQDAENPSYEYDQTMLSRNGNTFTALKEGSTVIRVQDGKTELTCNVTIEVKGKAIAAAAERIAETICSNGFIYSNSGCGKSLKSAISDDKKKVNCAIFASYALQEAGYLPEGKTIYYNGKLSGSGASSIEDNSNLEISYPDEKPKRCNLQPGDVCCFELKGNSYHVAIFAGYSDDGHTLWYTGGRDATDTKKAGGTFVDVNKMARVRQDYYNEVKLLIRAI